MSLRSRAFSLIEMLVVVTIIVVLLALLTPALDRAIALAEAAVCGNNLRNTHQACPQRLVGLRLRVE